jgi:hypothetical protein
MVKLSEHVANEFVKILYCGNSGTGKTGSLVSLVEAGYDLRVLDMDNGIKTLKSYIMKQCPDKIDLVDVETRRDRFKSTSAGVIVDGMPKAYVEATKLLTKWSDDSIPSEWGSNTIFVLDSLTALGDAAFEWAKAVSPGTKDPRQWYGTAGESVEHIIALLTSPEFHAHVIVITHVRTYEIAEGLNIDIPTSIGSALGRTLPRYFNNMVLALSSGSGDNVKRTISTVPTGVMDLKTEAPFTVPNKLPLSSGMIKLFEELKGTTKETTP